MPIKKADEVVNIGYDARSLRRGLKDSGRRIRGFFSLTKGLVAAASVAIAAVAVRAFAQQEEAEKRLRRGLSAMGKYSRETEAKLRGVASEIQRTTTLGDEQALGMMAALIQVGRIAPEQAGLAAKTVASIAEQTGRAITRVGRTFAEQMAMAMQHGTSSLGEVEKYLDGASIERIRGLKEVGKTAEATAALVEALNQRFAGGSDVVKGSTDEWKQVGNLWGDLTEQVGGIIHELLVGLIPAIKATINWVIGIGQKIQAFVFLAKGSIGDVQKYFQILALKIELYLLVALDTVGIKFTWFVDSAKYGLEILGSAIDFLKKQFWQFVDLVVTGFEYVDKAVDSAAEKIEESGKPLTKTQKRIVALRGEIDKLTVSLNENKNSWGEAWQRANSDTEAVLEERRAGVSKADLGKGAEVFGEGDAAGGVKPKDMSAIQDEIEIQKAMLAGLKDAELAHKREVLAIRREREKAQAIITAGGNLEEARLLQERADLREQLAEQALAKARDAAAVQAAEDLAEYELEMQAREVAKELGIELAAEDLELLKGRLQAERDAKLEARDQEIADRLAAHRQEVIDERRHGKEMAKFLKVTRSKDLKTTSNFLDTMASLNVGGSRKLLKIQEAAERAAAGPATGDQALRGVCGDILGIPLSGGARARCPARGRCGRTDRHRAPCGGRRRRRSHTGIRHRSRCGRCTGCRGRRGCGRGAGGSGRPPAHQSDGAPRGGRPVPRHHRIPASGTGGE